MIRSTVQIRPLAPAFARREASAKAVRRKPSALSGRRRRTESSRRDSGWQAMNNFSYVYRLRSVSSPDQVYIGLTDDLHSRLRKHNEGAVRHTAKFRPWEIEVAVAFRFRSKAALFERYLKTGSGREFARLHF
jgi:putative endonuclease